MIYPSRSQKVCVCGRARASQYTLTEEEIAATLRTARATGPASITVQAVEEAIAAVVGTRTSRTPPEWFSHCKEHEGPEPFRSLPRL